MSHGLVENVKNLWPEVEYKPCARHVYANLWAKWKGMQYREVIWKIAKSNNEVHFERHIKEL